ncbi:MAG: glycosyltransferase family 4 protein [Asgard group archaeon]|nr:glycosyltransferase family 4 protein [Asgard group archaeon]
MAKILMVKDGYLPDYRVDREAKALAQAGHKVSIICTEESKSKPEKHFEKVIILPTRAKARAMLPRWVKKSAKEYKQIIDEIKPDIIHAHDLMIANIVRRIIPKNTVFIYDDHEVWELYTKSIIRSVRGLKLKLLHIYMHLASKRNTREILKQIDMLIVVNDHWIDYYSKKGIAREKIISIENYTSENFLQEINDNLNLTYDFIKTDSRKKIVHTAKKAKISRDAERDIYNITKAVEKLDDWVIVIFGPKDEEYEKMGVIFFPHTNRLEFLVNCSQCDVALNTVKYMDERRHYASANRIYESLALGLKIISTKAQTYVEKFGEKAIWAGPETSVEDFKDILTNFEKYPTKEEIRLFSKNFSWENEMNKLTQKYEELIEK